MVFEEAYVKDESRTNQEQEGRDLIWTHSSLPALLWLTTSAFKQTQNGLFRARAGRRDSPRLPCTAHPRQGGSRLHGGWAAAGRCSQL